MSATSGRASVPAGMLKPCRSTGAPAFSAAARALQVNPVAGTFAGLALALNGLVTALVAPLLLRLF